MIADNAGILGDLVRNAERLVASGYYRSRKEGPEHLPFAGTLLASERFPVIAEVKMASPISVKIAEHGPEDLIVHYAKGGAAALSVLTEPNYFNGGLALLDTARGSGLPVLMKDFIVSREQIGAAAAHGASAVLLIQRIFSDRLTAANRDMLIDHAHGMGLEVVLEAADDEELADAMDSKADLVGINQRDLRTMKVDPGTGARLLKNLDVKTKPIIVMSAISRPEQVIELKRLGADAVLVGTELASAVDPEARLKNLAVRR